MHFKTISGRIWVIFTLIISFIVLAISLIYSYSYYYLNTVNQKSDLLTIHNILAERTFEERINFEELKNLKESGHFIYKDNNVISVNNPVQQIEGIDPSAYDVKKEIATLAEGELSQSFFDKKINKVDYLVYITSIETGGYFISYMPIYRDNQVLWMIMLLGLLFICGGTLATMIISKSITKPLQELEQFTKKIAKKDFSGKIEIKSEDEIGSLANSMLEMQNELQKVDTEEKQFLQSISHDLKTPVAVIIAHADSIIDGIYIDSVENTAEIIKNEAINLNKKIKKLLYFNTLDFTLQNQQDLEQVNLKDLLFNISSRFKFSNPNISWNLDLDDISMTADYDKLSVAIENIIDNDLRFAKSEIKISLKQEDQNIIINIFNDGEQIKEEALNKIFHNLYKDKKGNFGLGLAITKKIINFYNGTIIAENKENGVNFKIVFK